MRVKKERRIVWLFVGFFCVSLLGFVTRTYLPVTSFMVLLFLTIVSVGIFSFTYFATARLRISFLVACGTAVWLFLRYAGLREPVFPVLLLASLASVELYFRKK